MILKILKLQKIIKMMKIDWSGRSHKYTEKKLGLIKCNKKCGSFNRRKIFKTFENSLKIFLVKIFCTSSAASAIELISMLCQIKQGDEVIIPGHTIGDCNTLCKKWGKNNLV